MNIVGTELVLKYGLWLEGWGRAAGGIYVGKDLDGDACHLYK